MVGTKSAAGYQRPDDVKWSTSLDALSEISNNLSRHVARWGHGAIPLNLLRKEVTSCL